MTPDHLVHMANQIARSFRMKGEARAIADTADHLRKFWDPRMRRQLLDLAAANGQGLDKVARAAVEQLRAG